MPTILAVLQIFCQKVFHRVGNKVAKVDTTTAKSTGDLCLRSPHRVQQVAL